MPQQQKSPRTMIVDRFAAADINTDGLAIEEAAGQVRVTGSVSTEKDRQRVIAVLGDAQAAGVASSHEIDVRPAQDAGHDAGPSTDLRNPPEPA